MQTVIIAQKNLIQDIKNNPTFFNPFLSHHHVAFCPWDPLESEVGASVPELGKLVSRFGEWRAIVVCDESNIAKKNPFDVVGYKDPKWEEGVSRQEYLKQLHSERFKVFDRAANEPLTKLMTLLCEPPEIGDGMLWSQDLKENSAPDFSDKENKRDYEETADVSPDQSYDNNFDTKGNTEKAVQVGNENKIAELEEYREEAQKKQKLRKKILENTTEDFARPCQVICIAKRDYKNDSETFYSMWTPHNELQYSDFYNFNMYFDIMRYLIFDVSSRKTENEIFSNLKFEYALMTIACNELPEDCLHPNRVYLADCLYDQQAFEDLLTQYDAKLTVTAQNIEKDIEALSRPEKKEISDRDAENLLHSNVSIPVEFSSDFDSKTFFADYHGLGLSSNCPTDEMASWNSQKAKTTNALMLYLKQPRRAIKKATNEMRSLTNYNTEAANCLNDFQMDDLEAVMENQEIEMVSSAVPNVFDTEKYRRRLEESSDEVTKKTKTRMSRGCTIGLSVCVLVLFLIGLLPMWLGSLSEPLVIPGALIMMAVALVLLALTGFVCLFFLRHALVKKWKEYNEVMNGILSDIDNVMSQASEYISLACRFMQEHAALLSAKHHVLPQETKRHLLEKHLADVYNQREFIRNVYGDLIVIQKPEENTLGYNFDFLRTCTYNYPLPVDADQKFLMTFMQTGCEVEVPYKLMESITVRREEIYD